MTANHQIFISIVLFIVLFAYNLKFFKGNLKSSTIIERQSQQWLCFFIK
jgi:hypothetical protein